MDRRAQEHIEETMGIAHAAAPLLQGLRRGHEGTTCPAGPDLRPSVFSVREHPLCAARTGILRLCSSIKNATGVDKSPILNVNINPPRPYNCIDELDDK